MTYYGVSKLCNLLFTLHLAKLLKENGSGITVNAVHPGTVVRMAHPFDLADFIRLMAIHSIS